MEEKRQYRIYIDRALEAYNKATGEELGIYKFCEKFKITQATFVNYRNKKAPDAVRLLAELKEATGLNFDELVTEIQ